MLFDGVVVQFDEVPGPSLSGTVLSAMNSAWDEAVLGNPILFDGPVVLCSDMRRIPSRFEISWSRATYRYRTAPSMPAEIIVERHASVVLAERRKGREPEFSEVALVSQSADLPFLNAQSAD